MASYHLIIKGKVQGVFYRATAKEEAEKLGIKGWVKNTNEGHVEAVICGNEGQLKQFIQWCRQGPLRAKVSDVVVNKKEEEDFKNFSVMR